MNKNKRKKSQITHEERKSFMTITAKDCRWDYFKGTGKGGQKKNKTSNAVRCTHVESGAVGQSADGRSQWQNKKTAFKKMAESSKFKAWIRIETARKLGIEAEAEKQTEKTMVSQNLKIECKDENGKWSKYEDE